MHTLDVYSFLIANRIGVVKLLVRIVQNESSDHSLWMGPYEPQFHWEAEDNGG